jgi:predicted nucleotidyltransferase
MEIDRKWLLNPPTKKPIPIPIDFGIEYELDAFLEYLYLLIRGKIEFLEESDQLYKSLTADIDFEGILKQYSLADEAL